MPVMHRSSAPLTVSAAILFVLVGILVLAPGGLEAQRGGRGGRGGFAAQPSNLPDSPVAVPLPSISDRVTGPGTPYASVQSLPPGRGLDHYGYRAEEYFVSGTADGEPYRTRIVVRRPEDDGDFSGLVLVEAMHPSGSAHIFEFTSEYSMSSGHIAVEVVTGGMQNLTDHNAARYRDFSVSGSQTSEVLAQVGALLKEGSASPLRGLEVRKMVLGGTSATAGILIRYLPAHDLYRTPSMAQIFDGYLPHSTGATVPDVAAPVIQVPTMTEVTGANVTARQDGDAPGDQFRLYEFAGMAHVDSRDSVRFKPDPCARPVSSFPLQAYVSVALDHLFKWVDAGQTPPRARRILLDRNVDNDGSLMALDDHGNVIGGVPTPYVQVPRARYGVRNEGAVPLIANPSAYIAAAGQAGANQMCGLAGYEIAFSPGELRELYGSAREYRDRVRSSLDELEAAGWSLPVYRDMILADAAAVEF
jgi:hypothetical protein